MATYGKGLETKDLLALLRWAIKEVRGEWNDGEEGERLTFAEVVEIAGQLCGRLADMDAFPQWAGPLKVANRWLITWAIAMGEDGVYSHP